MSEAIAIIMLGTLALLFAIMWLASEQRVKNEREIADKRVHAADARQDILLSRIEKMAAIVKADATQAVGMVYAETPPVFRGGLFSRDEKAAERARRDNKLLEEMRHPNG